LKKFSRAEALKQTEHIYNVTLEIFKKSKTEKIPTLVAAMQMAEKRIYGGK